MSEWPKPKPFIVRSSERMLYKRCRRKYFLSSQNALYLEPKGERDPNALWMGTAFHFALEDYHGYNRFGDPRKALQAFVKAYDTKRLPFEWEYNQELLYQVLTHYLNWLPKRETMTTVMNDGKPLVEFKISLPLVTLENGREVIFSGTIDRVAKDSHGRIWIVDYKTRASFDSAGKLEQDPQMTAYVWALEQLTGIRAEGCYFLQFIKDYPKPPTKLKKGDYSKAKDQKTTHDVYRRTLLEEYKRLPEEYIPILNHFADQEDIQGDRFIRYDMLRRNRIQTYNEHKDIMLEVSEMTSPNLPIYPNYTRDCVWDCQFQSLCLAMSDGSDWKSMLKGGNYGKRVDDNELWRNSIEWPA